MSGVAAARPRVRSLSIRSRLLLVVGLVSAFAMTAFAALALRAEQVAARQVLAAELQAVATLLANRSTAALLFGDVALAEENLAALAAMPNVRRACLYAADGRRFAEYSSAGVTAPSLCPVQWTAAADEGGLLRVEVPVAPDDAATAGTLVLESSLAPLEQRLAAQIERWLLTGMVAVLLALLLAYGLEPLITGPVRRLAAVAERVVAGDANRARAEVESRDEIAELALAFNRMLDRLDAQARELREQADYTRVLFQQSPLPIIVIDARRNVTVDANAAAVAIYGFHDRAALLAAGVQDVSTALQYDGTPSGEAIKPYTAAALAGQPQVYEWRHRRPDGSEFDAEVHLSRFDSGGTPMLLASLFDVTDRKAAAEALRETNTALTIRIDDRTRELEAANAELSSTVEQLRRTQAELVRSERLASLGTLVAGVAHELDTPLGSVLLVASTLDDELALLREQLERGELKRSTLVEFLARQAEAQSLVVRNARRAAELIRRFKQLAVDQTSEQRRVFEVAEVVEEVMATLQPRLRRTSHRLELAVPAGLAMDSYPGPLAQVLTNLVMNALVHGLAERPGRIRLAAETAADSVRIVVEDDGVGIPAEHLARLFDPFFTTTLGTGGSGLGLYIVHSLVEGTLGGRVTVESTLGHGARFHLLLPRTAPAASTGV
jgi:PAS domain S-box-containing protein